MGLSEQAIFGRRTTPPHGSIAAEMWNDADAGTAPCTVALDNGDALIETPDMLQQRLRASAAAMQRRLDAFNRELSQTFAGLRVDPFFLFSERCWSNDNGPFLTHTLRLSPYDDWHAPLLASNRETAERLDLPLHPHCVIDAYVEMSDRVIGEQRALLCAEHERAGRTRDFTAYRTAHDEAIAAIKSHAAGLYGHWQSNWRDVIPRTR